MSMKMSEQDKNTMLDQLLPEGEQYKAKMWGVIMAGMKDIAAIGVLGGLLAGVTSTALGGGAAGAMGALSNEYCYIGLTEKRIVVCVIQKLDCSKVKGSFQIPFNEIMNVKVSKSIIPGRSVVNIPVKGGKIKLSLMTSSIGSDIQNQKENVQIFLQNISA
ncbi:hypothetical protein [Anaerosacchariphilus polymeriproducens]|uniref:YokE-like PH domain-containing protein n=1 Tax=Anaerosacchariphilus polymeriproducens TaxID=1812858 RepID=A0A371AR17_9FIRM|nr:hypothetical protein [Anaerosacchariphilus polymeriproducens]RDU22025.1 hypothetical protein DWV06_15950 [Anaerosacchariphilus polymeriproducens]